MAKKNYLLLDVWGWFIITAVPLESLLLPKTSPCKRFMAIAPGQTSKSGCQKCPVNSKSMSLCGNKIQVSSKKYHSMKSLKSPCSSQNPMGRWPSMTMLSVWHWRSNMLSKQIWITGLKRFVSYQVWLCTPRPGVNPFSNPTCVFYIHWGSIWGCSWAAPWAPHFAYGHGHR